MGSSRPLRTRGAMILATTLFATAACGKDVTGPTLTGQLVALTSFEGSQPALFLQNANGTERRRVSFTGAVDNIPGNVPPDLLPVRDENIKALGPVRWSPDGSKLAVVVTAAFDQSEVVIVNADGTGARVASPNSQIILSNVTWSQDGNRIAYTMSTLPAAAGINVFMTDLAQNRVTRLTTASGIGSIGVTMAWNAAASQLYYSRIIGVGDGPLFEWVSRILTIDVSSLAQTTLTDSLTGLVSGMSPGATWALLQQHVDQDQTLQVRDKLVRRPLTGATAKDLVSARFMSSSQIAGDPQYVLFTIPIFGTADARRYRVIDADGGAVGNLDAIETNATSADLRVGGR